MMQIKRDCAVYGAQRERLVFDLMKKFPIGPGNMSVILTMEEAAATITVMDEEIARLTAERDEARAEAAAAYERAAQVADEIAKDYDVMEPGKPDVYANAKTQRAAKGMVRMARDDIRALATEAETTALAEIVKRAVDAETRACAEVCDKQAETFGTEEYAVGQPLSSFSERFACSQVREAILARLDQRKEAGE